MINEKDFIKGYKDQGIRLVTLQNDKDLTVQISNYGARIVTMLFPDGNNTQTDIVLGHKSYKKYLESNEVYYGAAIGPYANRIAGAKFEFQGKLVTLKNNSGDDILHGGAQGFHNAIWNIEEESNTHLCMSLLHPNGLDGFPGNLKTFIYFELGNDNNLKISYTATCDEDTVINLTHHSFFNLNGEGNGKVLNHHISIDADQYNEASASLLQTGNLLNVEDSPFDLRNEKLLSDQISREHQQIERGLGFDHNYVLNYRKQESEPAASLYNPANKIRLDVLCSQPGMQFYTGNFLDASDNGKSGKPYIHRSAICLEPQGFPDSVNYAHFPSTELAKGEEYKEWMEYRLSNK